MTALALQLLAAIGVGILLSQIAKTAEKRYRAKHAAHAQAQWDDHVDQAVKVSETPLYERIAYEFAKDIDEEWKRVSTGGWATE